MHRWYCPILNGTLETFLWSIIKDIVFFDFLVINSDNYAQITFIDKSQLKYQFSKQTLEYLVHNWLDTASKGTTVNCTVLYCMKGHLKALSI